MRNTPNPGRTVDPRVAVPLPNEADEESGDATPDAAPADAQVKPTPPRNEQVGEGRPTRRWSEAAKGERETGGRRGSPA